MKSKSFAMRSDDASNYAGGEKVGRQAAADRNFKNKKGKV